MSLFAHGLFLALYPFNQCMDSYKACMDIALGRGKSFVIFGVFELIFAGVNLCLKTLFNTLSPDPINGFWQNLIHNTVDS